MIKRWIVWVIAADTIGFNLSIILSFLLRFHGELPHRNFQAYLDVAAIITASQVFIFYLYSLYSWHKRNYFYPVFFNLVKAVTINSLLATTVSYFVYAFAFPRTVILINWPLSITLISILRFLINRHFRGYFKRKLIVVGAHEEAGRICRELKEYANEGFEIMGFITDSPVEDGDFLGCMEELRSIVDRNRVTDIVVGHGRYLLDIIGMYERVNADVYVFPSMYELLVGKAPLTEIGGLPLLEMRRDVMESWQAVLKRILDIVISFLALLILSPLFGIISLLIKLTSKGPIFYRQTRIGRGGKEFTIYKFRTMLEDAERDIGATFASENDPRVTGVGKVLRKWRLDELPQLYNVLIGDMSLVGPRPERPEFVKEFLQSIPLYAERLRVKPGITGLAQVNGRYDSSPEDKLRYDLAYIYNYTLLLDMKILLLTFRVIFTGWGAR